MSLLQPPPYEVCRYLHGTCVHVHIRSDEAIKLDLDKFGAQLKTKKNVIEHTHALVNNLFAALLRGSMVVNRIHSYPMLSIV